jgi:hypothetical protein
MSERVDVAERLRTQIEAPESKHLKEKAREIQGDQKIQKSNPRRGPSIDLDGIFIEMDQKELLNGVGYRCGSK